MQYSERRQVRSRRNLSRRRVAILCAALGVVALLAYIAVPWLDLWRPQKLPLLRIGSLTGMVFPSSAVLIDSSYEQLPRLQLRAKVCMDHADFVSFMSSHTDWKWTRGVSPYPSVWRLSGWWTSGDVKQAVWYTSYARPHPEPRRHSQHVLVDLVVAPHDTSSVVLYIEANDS